MTTTDVLSPAIAVARLLAVAGLLAFAPGWAWLRGAPTALPLRLLQIAASMAWTTGAGLALALAGQYSLWTLLALCAAATAAGLCRRRRDAAARQSTSWAGAWIAAAVLVAYWPPFETHVAGSDSTTYVAAGVHLSRTGALWIDDPLADVLPEDLREQLYDSAAGLPGMTPFLRVPGSLVMRLWTDAAAWPAFFPAPMIWSAVASQTLGPALGGAYAPVFCALATWAVFEMARRLLGVAGALLAATLVAVNAANVWTGRFPMSEAPAFFFLWTGLLALDAWGREGRSFDARFAALMFGTAAIVRIDAAIWLGALLVLREAIGSWRPLPASFYRIVGALLLAMVVVLSLAGGASWMPIWMVLLGGLRRATDHPLLTSLFYAAAASAFFLVRRRVPRRLWGRLLGAGVLSAATMYYLVSMARPQGELPLRWLQACLGWPAAALAAIGAWYFLSRRAADPPRKFFVLAIGVATAIVVYNAHSVPVLPMGWRRFSMLVAPGILVLAAAGVVAIARRSRVAAAIAAATLVLTVTDPSRLLLSSAPYRDSFERFEAFAAELPRDGTLIIDESLAHTLVAVPLWLLEGRTVLPVRTTSGGGCSLVSLAAYPLEEAGHGPVRLLTREGEGCKELAGIEIRDVRTLAIDLALPSQHPHRAPREVERFELRLELKDLVTPWRARHERRAAGRP